MIRAVSIKQFAIGRLLKAYCLSLIAVCFCGCSVPNMQSQQCSEASDSVKEFYSWYMGTDAEERAKRPAVYRKFISPDFPLDSKNWESDPYLLSHNFPTTFKVGKCEMVDESHVRVQVQLYWRPEDSDGKTVQKEIYADAVNKGDAWQIAKIEDR